MSAFVLISAFWRRFVLFFFHLHSVCVHSTVLLLPQSPYESPVNLVPSSQPVSPDIRPSIFSFRFGVTHSIILLPWSLMWMSVVFICCVCVWTARDCGTPEYFNRHCWVYCITLLFIISTVASQLILFLFFFICPPAPLCVCVCVCVQYVVVTVCLKAGMETTAWTRVGALTHS